MSYDQGTIQERMSNKVRPPTITARSSEGEKNKRFNSCMDLGRVHEFKRVMLREAMRVEHLKMKSETN
jgi:hypothetical protein